MPRSQLYHSPAVVLLVSATLLKDLVLNTTLPCILEVWLGWSPLVLPTALATGWPSAHSDPKWVFPRLDLALSPPRPEGEKDEDNDVATDEGWGPLEPSIHPTLGWGFDDRDPPPSTAVALD